MSKAPSDRALGVARHETEDLVEGGAEAVFLTGSHARGDAHPESDLDLRVVGDGSSPPLKRRDGFLISTSWMTSDEHAKVFGEPAEVGQAIPGWRTAVILHDPDGIAADLKKRAEAWSWDEVSARVNEWVAEQITDYAEEVHTLIGNLEQDQLSGAAAIRSQLAMHLAEFLAVHKRLLYGSENDLWDEVGKAMGEEYERHQTIALGLEPVSLKDSSRAALALFELAASETEELLNAVQKEVVEHARELVHDRLS